MADRQRHPLFTLLLLTLIGGVLRFGYIEKPAIWGDEAQTWRRISGNYQQLVDELRIAGFMPGQYVLTWWIKEGFPIWGEYQPGQAPNVRSRGPEIDYNPRSTSRQKWENFTPTLRLVKEGFEPTPLVMRFLPALCGTLMVPAMYFLASRLVARRTALLVALFTCFSAYLLNYSRDAKMYMQFWFFAALHVGCLLWWLEAYRRRAPVVVSERLADETIVGGVHQILPERHINRIGDAFTAAPAERRVVTDTSYPSRLETAVRWMAWITSGLGMIAFNAIGLGIVGIEVLIFLATIPLRSQWIASLVRGAWNLLPRRVAHADGKVVSTDTARAAAGAFPPSLAPSRSEPAQRQPFRFFIPPIFGFVIGCAAVVALWYSYKDFTRFYQRVNPNDEISQMDLGDAGISWVDPYNDGRTIGSYLLYSATSYLMNWEWVKTDQLEDVDPQALRLLRWSAMGLLIAIGAGIVPWRKLISRRPSDVSILRGGMPLTAAFIVACWLLLPAYGFYCASGAWTEDGARADAPPPTLWMASWIFPGVSNADAGKLAGVLGAELSEARRAKGWEAHDWSQLLILHNSDWTQVRWIILGAIGAVVLFLALDRWFSFREKMRLAGLGLLGLVLFWVLANFVYLFTPQQNGSIWMPRYLGFVWPAFAIAACVLIRRLPLAPLRYLVVAAFVVVNLGVFYHRVELGEPRTDLMARDYKIARDSKEIRMFARTEGWRWRGAPGYGSMTSLPAVYYVSLETDQPMTPSTALATMRRSLDLDPLGGDVANGIRSRLNRDPQCNEFILWLETDANGGRDVADWLRQTLDPTWSASQEPTISTVYEHWTWRRIYRLERHHWKRSPSTQPTTRPAIRATKPATQPAVSG